MNDALKIENNDIMNKFQKTENILNDVQNIIEVSQKEAYRAVNTILSQRNWLIIFFSILLFRRFKFFCDQGGYPVDDQYHDKKYNRRRICLIGMHTLTR